MEVPFRILQITVRQNDKAFLCFFEISAILDRFFGQLELQSHEKLDCLW